MSPRRSAARFATNHQQNRPSPFSPPVTASTWICSGSCPAPRIPILATSARTRMTSAKRHADLRLGGSGRQPPPTSTAPSAKRTTTATRPRSARTLHERPPRSISARRAGSQVMGPPSSACSMTKDVLHLLLQTADYRQSSVHLWLVVGKTQA